ncbi:alpha-amylase family protein [Bifidobacterium aquikefiri]|uniref:alpha-amylase family protein n=1 Tax=Bifidobacterium aquikefiri TaxID=1653207 RepID=UPI0023F2B50F|nr:alpha-amylase family protein [Bifidobacterium aquikefiri]
MVNGNRSKNASMETIIWWHVYPLGFLGAPIRPRSASQRVLTHRLRRLIPWLDYMSDLGATGLFLGPIFDSQTHGYDTIDYFSIDPRLGDLNDFDDLMRACRERGITVMLDGVFNHVGTGFPAFRNALAGLDDQDMFTIRRSDQGNPDYAKFEGHASLPELNHDSPRVAQLVRDVMEFWLAKGIGAWRLDAAYTTQTHFWQHVLPEVRTQFPKVWFMGEVIQADYPTVIRESGFDSLTQYELWKAIWSSLKDGNFFELDWCLQRHDGFMDVFTPQTFIGNHDVTRIASQVGIDKAALACVVQFSVGGVPSIYYGDELGMTGVKEDRPGGDDAVRPAFPAKPQPFNELSESQSRIFGIYRSLIEMRKANPWLAQARTKSTLLENRRYMYESTGEHGETLSVDLQLDPHPHAEVHLPDGSVLSIAME